MTSQPSHEELMRYLDGEVSPEERARIEEAIAASTELRREIAVFTELKGGLQGMELGPGLHRDTVWDQVNRRLGRPIGWVFLIVGVAIWAGYAAYLFTTSSAALIEKLATGGIVIGVLILLSSVIFERIRELPNDPYRDVMR